LAAKNFPVKIGPQNGVFSQNKGINIIFSYRDPKKAHPWLETTFFEVFFVKKIRWCRL